MTTLATVSYEAVTPSLPARPYPGLRPFEADEWPIFFGREEMIDEVIDHLAERCLLLVHGSSGSGKSSLIRAGILPRLERQHRRNRLGWSTAALRPAGGPLWNLAEALVARDRRAANAQEVDALRRRFDEGGANLKSIVSDLPDMADRRLCLLVDQFEELFQYVREHSLEEATLFVDLIASTLEDDTTSPLRVILTMRSDYLGECVRWPNLAGAVNRAQYLLPPMGPAALRDAICRPAELYQGKINPALADRMIADAQGEQDQLPLIQHGLMRLWDLATVTDGTRRLDMTLYEKHGPLTRILDEHAEEIARRAESGNDQLPLTSGIFRALSDLNDAGQPIRRPQTLKELIAVTGATENRVRAVIDAFRADGVSFLKPYGRERLDERKPVDIAHEALMRCWKRLADRATGWLWDEFRQGLTWQSLLAQAELFLKDNRNVLSPPTTDDRGLWLSSRTEAWAARYGDSWDKVATLMDASRAYAYRLRRNARLLSILLGVVALLIIGALCGGLIVYRNVTQALDELYAEQAKVIWSEIGSSSDTYFLTPRQRNAFWQVAGSEPRVREKFVGWLSEDPDLAARFGTYAAIISRAIGLGWPQTAEQAQAALGHVLDAIGKTTGSDPLGALARAVQALAPKLTAEQAQAALGRVLDAIGKTSDSDALGALAQVVQALAPKLTAEQAQAALGRVLDAIGKTTDSDQLGALAQVVQALAPKLTAEQAQAALGRVLDAFGKTSGLDALGALAQAVQALAPKLTAEQAQPALGRVLDAFGKTTDSPQLGALAQVVQALAPKLTAEQAQPALGRVLDAIGKTTDSHRLGALAQAVQALSPKLTAEQAQAALGRVLDAIGAKDSDPLGALAQAVQALAPKLTPEQAQVALGRVLDAMGETADPGRVEALAPAVLALVLKLTPEQAQAALGRVLDAFGITSGLDALGALAQAVQALAPKLTAEQAQAALGRVLDAIGKTTDSHQLGALAQVVQALSPKLRAGQAEAALGRVVDAIGKTTDSDPLGAPRVVQALAPKLTAEQAQAALGRVLDAIGETFYSDALGALAQAVQALAPKLTAEQAQAALGRVLDAIGKTTGSDALGALTQAVQALAPKLTAEQAEQAIARVLSALGWSSSSAEAQQWAKELAALLERLPDSKPASRVLTEAVKFPVAAGEPTDELLAALQKYLPSLPGPTAGLLENLDWLKQNEPSIDLTSRAVCPPPPREELHCP